MASTSSQIEHDIRRTLRPAEYAQLVKDLRAAQRAFDRMEIVAPDLLRDLVRSVNQRRGTLMAAHEAMDDLIQELRVNREQYVAPPTQRETISLVKR